MPVTDTVRVKLALREGSPDTDAENDAEREARERVAEPEPDGRLLAELERHAELVKDVVEERHWEGVGERLKVGLGDAQGDAVSDGVIVNVAVEEVESVDALEMSAEAEADPDREPTGGVSVGDTVSQRDIEGDPEEEGHMEEESETVSEGDAQEVGVVLSEKLTVNRAVAVALPPEGECEPEGASVRELEEEEYTLAEADMCKEDEVDAEAEGHREDEDVRDATADVDGDAELLGVTEEEREGEREGEPLPDCRTERETLLLPLSVLHRDEESVPDGDGECVTFTLIVVDKEDDWDAEGERVNVGDTEGLMLDVFERDWLAEVVLEGDAVVLEVEVDEGQGDAEKRGDAEFEIETVPEAQLVGEAVPVREALRETEPLGVEVRDGEAQGEGDGDSEDEEDADTENVEERDAGDERDEEGDRDARPLSDAEALVRTLVLPQGDADGDALSERDPQGDAEELGERLMEAVPEPRREGEELPLAVSVRCDGEVDTLGVEVGEGDPDLEDDAERDGDGEAEPLRHVVAVAQGEVERDAEEDTLEEREARTEKDCEGVEESLREPTTVEETDTVREAVPKGERDEETEPVAEKEAEAQPLGEGDRATEALRSLLRLSEALDDCERLRPLEEDTEGDKDEERDSTALPVRVCEACGVRDIEAEDVREDELPVERDGKGDMEPLCERKILPLTLGLMETLRERGAEGDSEGDAVLEWVPLVEGPPVGVADSDKEAVVVLEDKLLAVPLGAKLGVCDAPEEWLLDTVLLVLAETQDSVVREANARAEALGQGDTEAQGEGLRESAGEGDAGADAETHGEALGEGDSEGEPRSDADVDAQLETERLRGALAVSLRLPVPLADCEALREGALALGEREPAPGSGEPLPSPL